MRRNRSSEHRGRAREKRGKGSGKDIIKNTSQKKGGKRYKSQSLKEALTGDRKGRVGWRAEKKESRGREEGRAFREGVGKETREYIHKEQGKKCKRKLCH